MMLENEPDDNDELYLEDADESGFERASIELGRKNFHHESNRARGRTDNFEVSPPSNFDG
jgi:hypothetical protein